MQPVVVLCTVPDPKQAQSLSRMLVSEKLAACVNIIGPVSSVYFWEGEVQEEQEWKLFIKSFREKTTELEARILAEHSYSVPEITVIDAAYMQPSYFDWMHSYINEDV